MTLKTGDVAAIAGYPGIRAKVKSIEHAERILRAHVYLHDRNHKDSIGHKASAEYLSHLKATRS
jgi:hypothetical protein